MRRSRCLPALPLTILAALLAGACFEAAPTATEAQAGEIRFDYQSQWSGSFRASGVAEFSHTGDWTHGTWAAALQEDRYGEVRVVGFRAWQEPRGDAIILRIPERRVGAYEVDDTCSGEDSPCAEILFGVGMDVSDLPGLPDDTAPAGPVYRIRSGQIRVDAVDGKRMQGVFEGTGQLVDGDDEIRIENGVFDVPVFS